MPGEHLPTQRDLVSRAEGTIEVECRPEVAAWLLDMTCEPIARGLGLPINRRPIHDTRMWNGRTAKGRARRS